jgi:peroxiredoxin
MKHRIPLLILLACLAPGFAWGQEIGEAAPPLVVQKWVKGQPVEIKPGTNTYVLEIWQSTIPACRLAITYLNTIQNRFKTNGVIVVGLSDEPAESLEKFVQNEATNIEYAVAADQHRHTVRSYMGPIKQRIVPYVFVVGTNGEVLWHGNSFGALTKALELITSGKFDADLAAKREIAEHQMEQYLGLARRRDFRAATAGLNLLENRTNDVSLLCDMAYQISTAPQLPKRDFALASQALDQAEKITSPTNTTVMSMRSVWLFASGKRDQGIYLAKQALASTQNPVDQARIKLLLHTMESQLAAAKAKASINNTNPVVPAPPPASTPAAAVSPTNPPAAK